MTLCSIDTKGQLRPGLDLEWLLTNGLGGFASSTVVGCNTRRYHGLLCAAMKPPVGRIMTLNRLGEALLLDGRSDDLLEFSVNQFGPTFHPRGDQYLRSFELGPTARWRYVVSGVRIDKEVLLLRNRNVVAVRYTIEPDRQRQVEMWLLPMLSLRDFHHLRSEAGANFQVTPGDRRVSVSGAEGSVHIASDGGQFTPAADWWHGQTYALETERGQDDAEDLFTPGRFVLKTTGRAAITLWAGVEPVEPGDWEREAANVAARVSPSPPGPRTILNRAAADFIVGRQRPDGQPAMSVIAGYPWFGDWGRDTMIALPGLLLCTRRFDEAAQVLDLFADYVSQGMVPNLFDDYTSEPHYNTVDASLWFIHAAHEFRRLSGDDATFRGRLLPACEAILQGYQQGTRFNIRMDPRDGLISAGDADTQLTWMDARCDNISFTPRQGKAVEINALWYNALMLMERKDLAARVAAGFVSTFWRNAFRGLYDVASDGAKDASIRPNQIFAVSLPHSPLSDEQQGAVVEVVRRELLTPYGLRTLEKSDPRYRGRYSGPAMQRDAAYHNGTVWPWLIGPFLAAYLRVHHRSGAALQQARTWLTPLLDHLLKQACLGQISEIFDGDEPHRPVGCFAQAWSVAEVLRMAAELEMT